MRTGSWQLITLFIVAFVIHSGVAYIGIFYYQPFKSVDWKQDINGSIGQVITDGSSVYVANYSWENVHYDTQTNADYFGYSVYKLNYSTGKIDWITIPLYFQDQSSLFFNNNATLGMKIWLQNNTLFAVDGSFEMPLSAYNYTIYSFNTGNGELLGSQNISFNNIRNNFSNVIFGAIFQPIGSKLYFSFINVTQNINHKTNGITVNSTFCTFGYELLNHTFKKFENASIPIPLNGGFGTGDEHAIISGNTELTYLDWMDSTIVENVKTDQMRIYNVTSQTLTKSRNSIYLGSVNNTTLTVYTFNSTVSTENKDFSYTNPMFSNASSIPSITIKYLPTGYLLVSLYKSGYYSANNTLVGQRNILFDFNVQGQLQWTDNYSALLGFPHLNYVGKDQILASFVNTGISGVFELESFFALINYTNGHILWQHSHYSSASQTGSRVYFSPQYVETVYAVSNNKVLFYFGNQLELANIP